MEALTVSLLFYMLVMALCEVCRQVVDALTPAESLRRRALYELLATLQVCTCVYENGLVLKHFGVRGFFVAVVCLLVAHSFLNRGALVSPAATVEAFWAGRAGALVFCALLAAQLAGGYLAYRLARQLWRLGFSPDHTAQYANFFCKIAYKVPVLAVFAYEVGVSFLFRYVVGRTSPSLKRYVVAFFLAAALSTELVLIGIPGLNPIIASSRIQGCEGLSHALFLGIYWLGPITGTLLAATVQNRQSRPKVD